MGIKANFTAPDIHKIVQKAIDKANKINESRLIRIGLEFVTDARLKADFTDRTGNLRSSIGYILMKEGKQIGADFEKSTIGTDKATGKITGVGLADSISGKYSNGYALIVVAGMEYAAAVESKGRDVLTGSSLAAVKELKKHFKQR